MTLLKEEKNALRKRLRGLQRGLDPDARKITDSSICARIPTLPEYSRAETIFCFIGIDWEIDTRGFIDRAISEGKRIAVPLCKGPGIMEARFINGLHELIPGAYGIPEPGPSCPVCSPDDIDLAIIPCVACDRSCMRLGQGGGYYDRFMENAVFSAAALCRECVLQETLPAEPWDLPVDYVVTEDTTISKEMLLIRSMQPD